MASARYIVTNIAYGTGPYLRTTELAIAVNDVLEQQGRPRMKIIVPLVYGDQQRRVMAEHFAQFLANCPDEWILDETYGRLLGSLFYGGGTYEEGLRRWLENIDDVSRSITTHLKAEYGEAIALELHRSPRVSFGLAPSAFVSFASIADILGRSIGNPDIAIDPDLLQAAAKRIRPIEERHDAHFITEPGTFSFAPSLAQPLPRSVSIPPTIPLFGREVTSVPHRGIYVTITGIPGLERLYEAAGTMGLTVYSNNVDACPGAVYAPPSAIGHDNIVLHVARSGWSSVWISQITGTPLLAAPWDRTDDPEIYWNNRCIESLGLGTIYDGQTLEEVLESAKHLRGGIESYNEKLRKTFGTLDGTPYAAERIVEQLLS